jgi:hypothetical protein
MGDFSYQLPVTSYQLPVTSYQLPVTSYQLPVTSYQWAVGSKVGSFNIFDLKIREDGFCL